MDRDILSTVFKILLAAALFGLGGLAIGIPIGRYALPACPPTPEFKALSVPTPAATATPRPTYTARPTYTPYPTPAPTADPLAEFYHGAFNYCVFTNQALGIGFDCLAFMGELYGGDWHGIDVPGYRWPLPTPTAGVFHDSSGSGEASPVE